MSNDKECIYIIFDGPPGPVSGRFVEVEDSERRSIRVGQRVERDDGLWALRIDWRELTECHGPYMPGPGRSDPYGELQCEQHGTACLAPEVLESRAAE